MSRIRKRPVSFGNPALGTYHGNVYTLEPTDNSNHHNKDVRQRPLIEGAVDVRRLVAMVDVPPEQVPEGILNLARSHRPWIDHVRIVIAENHAADKSSGADDEEEDEEGRQSDVPYSIPPSPGTSAMESAASILAAEQQVEASTAAAKSITAAATTTITSTDTSTHPDQPPAPKNTSDFLSDYCHGGSNNYLSTTTNTKPNRTYLVLLELSSEEAAQILVEDLHRQPYTSLDETQVANVHHVIALQGQDGVSLMSPFFAPATRSAANGKGLEILHSTSSEKPLQDTTTTATNTSGSGANHPHHPPSEDYHCAVCLEHMELDIVPVNATNGGATAAEGAAAQRTKTPILTTVCNHSFHMECILQWQDSPCPVCRYDHSGLNEALSQCHICGTTQHNYVCLICGVISCGGPIAAVATSRGNSSSSSLMGHPPASTSSRTTTGTRSLPATASSEDSATCRPVDHTMNTDPVISQQRMSGSHARLHYDETLHAYALDTQTQHVWDFAGQGYVHRLLQNKDDGKLVEVSDPNNTTSEERTLSPGLTQEQEGEMVHRKLEGFASQYYTLLKSQLEQQRIYYEGRLEEIRREYKDGDTSSSGNNTGGNSSKGIKSSSSSRRRHKATDLMVALKHEHQQLAHRLTSLKSRCTKVREDVSFLRHMNESLQANKGPLEQQIKEAQQERLETRQMCQGLLPPLQEKVTRLMLQLERQLDEDDAKVDRKPAPR